MREWFPKVVSHLLTGVVLVMTLSAAPAWCRQPVILIVPGYGEKAEVIEAWNANLGESFDLVSSAPLTFNLSELSSVKVGSYAWTTPSFQSAQSQVSKLPVTLSWFIYDFEYWKNTPASEQKDVVGTSKAIRSFCAEKKWKTGITLMYRDGLKLAEKLAPYYDLYIVQCQNYQKKAQWEETVQYLRSVEKTVHRVNPKCLVACQLGSTDDFGDGEEGGGVSSALRLYEATKGFIQVYSIWWPPEAKPLIRLLKAMENID